MYNYLWNFLRGYVIIEIRGFSAERFVNMAAYRGVVIKNFAEDETGKRTFRAALSDFRTLVLLARKTGCKLVIKQRVGLPFLLHKYRHHRFFVIGAVMFAVGVWFLSSFIWLVEVNGAKTVNLSELTAYLAENGIEAGKPKKGVDERATETKILRRFPEISWVNVDVKGTRATVILTEVKPKVIIEQNTVPSDIIAAKDGIISKMATSQGTPLFRPGDTVRAGDVVVTGKITLSSDEFGLKEKYIRAESKVYAKNYYTETASVPIAVTEPRQTGNKKREYTLVFLDKTIDLPRANQNYRQFEIVFGKKTLKFGADYPLPFSIGITEYRETEPFRKTLTIEEAERVAVETAIESILSKLGKDAEIIQREIKFDRDGGNVTTEVTLTINERIDAEQTIIK